MTWRDIIKTAWLKFRSGWEASVPRKGEKFDIGSPSTTTEVERPYEQSVWVQASIKKVAQPIGSVPLRFEDEQTETEIDDERLEQFWKHPARRLSWFDTVEATVGWLGLAGESFWVLGDEWLNPFPAAQVPEPFVVARPDRMKHHVVDGALLGWVFRDKIGRDHKLLPEQVLHLKFWNPYDDWRGLAPYLAAKIATEADYFASTFNRNLWQQNGDRGPFVISEDTTLTQEQREAITTGLREKRRAAQSGQFKAAFLTGNIKVEDPKIQTIDATAAAVRLQNRHEIAIAFGVPPSMFDVIASYSIGSASDRFILIEETCMPMGAKIMEPVTMISKMITGQANLCAYLDWDEHSTMQAVRRERIDAAMKLFSTGMPMESINDYLKLGMQPFSGWDTGFLSFSLAPVEGVINPAPPEPLDMEGNEPEEDDTSLGASIIRAAFEASNDVSEWQRRRPKREIAMVRHHEAQVRPIAKAYESAFTRVLMKARAETLAKVAALGQATKSIQTKAAAADFLFDAHKFGRELVVAMRSVSASALEIAGQTVLDELEIRDPWKTPPAEVLNFNKARQNKIVGVGRTVFQQINGTVEESIKAGDSIDTMANKIRETFNDITKGRAKTIARTEAGAAYGQGRQVAMESAGVQWKEWLTSGLPNVRPAHVQANGQRVRVTDKFEVGGEELDSPGDPNGSPENVINCNCVAVAVPGPSTQEVLDDL